LFQVLERFATGGGGFPTLAPPRREIPTSGVELDVMFLAHGSEIVVFIAPTLTHIKLMMNVGSITRATGEAAFYPFTVQVDKDSLFGDRVKGLAMGGGGHF